MEPSPSADDRPDDVLSIGKSRTPRWVRLGAALVVVLLGLGAYRVLSPTSSLTAPGPAEAAEKPRVFPAAGQAHGNERGVPNVELRLGGLMVTLRGRGLHEPGKETSATALGRIRYGWLVRLTSAACHDSANVRTSYGVARATGLFTPWDSVRTRGGPVWRSPDHTQVLRMHKRKLAVHRISTGKVLARFNTRA